MKFKSVIVGFALCLLSVLSVFGLTGCGDVSLDAVKKSFENLDAAYASYSSVFTQGNCEGLETEYYVSNYDQFILDSIKAGDEDYIELVQLYNATLVISSDYIDKNRTYVLALDEKNFDAAAKEALKNLNESLISYTSEISEFVKAQDSLNTHFHNFAASAESSNQHVLAMFKAAYGKLVKRNVELSTSMAKMVETTKIFDLLKATTPTVSDTETVKEYIRAKALPIFCEFKITEMANKMRWNAQRDGDGVTKNRIDQLIEKLDESFAKYKTDLLLMPVKDEPLTSKQLNAIFDLTDEFFVEADSYFQALSGLDLYSLAVGADNNMENYLKTNEFAEIYLQKLEQFVETSLPNFMTFVAESLLKTA